MDTVVKSIAEAKKNAGAAAFLSLSLDGECTLWDREPTSARAAKILGRWELNLQESDQLIDNDIVDRAV